MGFAGPTADDLGDIFQTASFGQWHVDSFYDSCYDSLDCFWGFLSHSFSERGTRVGLACEMGIICLILHCIVLNWNNY